MKRLFLFGLLLTAVLAQGQYTVPFRTGAIAASGACTPGTPVADHRYRISDAGTTCNGGSACTNGAGIDTLVDLGSVGGDNLNQSTAGQRPTYNTSAINGLADASFDGTTPQVINHFDSGLSGSLWSWMIVLKPGRLNAENGAVGGVAGGLELKASNSSGHQALHKGGTSLIGAGTATLSTTSYQTLAGTYNASTGAWNLYICSGGTCTSDGSGTATNTLTAPVWDAMGVGLAGGISDYYQGRIVEFMFSASIWSAGNLSTNANYVSCTYGL